MSELLVRKIEISNKTHIEEAKCDEGIRYQLPELYGQMTERWPRYGGELPRCTKWWYIVLDLWSEPHVSCWERKCEAWGTAKLVFGGEALVISRGRMLVNLLRCGGEEQGRFLRFMGNQRGWIGVEGAWVRAASRKERHRVDRKAASNINVPSKVPSTSGCLNSWRNTSFQCTLARGTSRA